MATTGRIQTDTEQTKGTRLANWPHWNGTTRFKRPQFSEDSLEEGKQILQNWFGQRQFIPSGFLGLEGGYTLPRGYIKGF